MSAPKPQRQRGRTGVVLALALILWTPCCDEAADVTGDSAARPAQPRLVLGPGDALLDHIASVQVVKMTHSNLAPAVRSAMEQVLTHPQETIPADGWLVGGTVDASKLGALGLPVKGELLRFRCHPTLRPDLGLGRVWLKHDGRVLPASEGEL